MTDDGLDDESDMPRSSVDEDGDAACSFCGKSKGEVRALIRGPRAYICDECVRDSVRKLRADGE